MTKCTTDEETLREIFGDNKTWLGKNATYALSWCRLCDVASISNNACDCHGSSCNGSGCQRCDEDFAMFHKAKTHVGNYLTEDEVKAYEKGLRLQRFIVESIAHGDTEIDWKHVVDTGAISNRDMERFSALIAEHRKRLQPAPTTAIA